MQSRSNRKRKVSKQGASSEKARHFFFFQRQREEKKKRASTALVDRDASSFAGDLPGIWARNGPLAPSSTIQRDLAPVKSSGSR